MTELKRFALPVLFLATSAGLCYFGRMGGSGFVGALAVISVGYYAEPLVRVWNHPRHTR